MHAEMIDYIRFTTISPESIKKMSVAKLIVPDTYNDDGYPIDGGLIDQRLGVIDPGLKCKTCGGRAKSCPGHFGHIELVRPTIHPEFAKTLYMLLQVTCESCHRLLINEKQLTELNSDIEEALLDNPDVSLGETQSDSSVKDSMLKRLKNVKKCPYCGTEQRKIKLERPTFFSIGNEKLRPDAIRDWMEKISDDDLILIGIDPKATRPEWFVITTLLVPPVNVRPSITLETGDRSEDDLTHKLVDIIRTNQRLEQDIDAGAPQIIIDDLWELLQYQITTYFNNETPGVPVSRHRSTRPLKTLAQRLKGKEGRVRYNLSGKRVNFSARTVISPDGYLSIDQVGVPPKIAENLSVPFYVTQWNLDAAKKLLESESYPMVINMIMKDGMRKRATEATRKELLEQLVPGCILERQLVDGDIALFNRQPTLHRVSIMAHEIKVLPGRTMRINVSITFPYNADFDGDEMNLHVPQTLEAQAEARYLMKPSLLLPSARTGTPIGVQQEDQLAGLYLLTNDDAYFTKVQAASMLANVGVYEFPKKAEKDGRYHGRAIFSMILPKGLDFSQKSKLGEVLIKDGELISGVVDNTMVGIGNASLTLLIYDKYGPDEVRKFILNASKLSLAVAYISGISISLRDYYNSDKLNKDRENIINEVSSKVAALTKAYREKKLQPLPGMTAKQTYEAEAFAELNIARSIAETVIKKNVPISNNAMLMSTIKARGNILNYVQTSMLLGEQSVRGERVKRGYSGRVLPYLHVNQKDPLALGFVASSFLGGLNPVEYIIHAMGSRDSAMSKSLITAVSGYLQRRLINALQDFYVENDLSVRDASGKIVQTIYGGDGMDPMMEAIAKE